MSNQDSFSLKFGALSPPIWQQLSVQGYPITEERARAFQRVADAITLLKIHGYVPDEVADRTRKRLIKRIAAEAIR